MPLNIKIVVFVGGFTESKGYNRVLKAIDQIDDVFAILIGKGKLRNDNPKIIFSGSIEHNRVAEMLSCADLFVLPTRDEGSSNALVEAMSCGLPIISSNIPAVREQCDSSFSILVNPNDVEEISTAIKSVIFNEDILTRMSRNALKRSEKYDLRKRAMQIADFIQDYL